MVRARPNLPAGHGEVLTRPVYGLWADVVAENREITEAWDFRVAGVPVANVRRTARAEALGLGQAFSERIGIPLREPAADAPIVATGHQPELYHPGVWVKDFLLQRLADETAAAAFDVVVDSDAFDIVAVTAPCITPEVRRCRQYLDVGRAKGCFACTPLPGPDHLDDFVRATDSMLATLPAPAVRRHFSEWSQSLKSASRRAENLSELMTFTRRIYESAAGTDYLELPVTAMCRGEAWALFVADIAFDAERFAAAYNTELAAYRQVHKTRTAAQPFPDLAMTDDAIELPLWALKAGSREPVFARRVGQGVELVAGGEVVCAMDSAEDAARIIGASAIIAPKALALTMFVRTFACDLFIHGVGGGRYDRVTDGVIRRYYGVTPPQFVVASLTMYLPLGMHLVTPEEVSAARERLNRLTHNPDALLGEVDFDDEAERVKAIALAREKASLVASIAEPGADKKTLGMRIKEVNAELARLLEPLREQWAAELSQLEAQVAHAEILTDRTYPYAFWSPHEVADKVW